MFIRAKTVAEAKAILLERYQNATFARSADLEVMVSSYTAAALWISRDDRNDKNLDESGYELAEEAAAHFRSNCEEFLEKAGDLLALADEKGYGIETAGYDFWMAHNGHGADFRDRDLGDLGEKLAEVAKTFSEDYLYIGDDDLIHSGNEYRTTPRVDVESSIPTP